VPHDRRLQSVSFVDVHRTKRLPEQVWRTGCAGPRSPEQQPTRLGASPT
jgi:hypothetical protein